MVDQPERNSELSQEEIDADAVLAELEAEDEQDSAFREQRAKEYGNQSLTSTNGRPSGFVPSSTKQEVFVTLKSDDDTLTFTTEHERAIVHFFHPDFARCSVMDDHLDKIAERHGVYGGAESGGEEIAFGRVNVNNAPFVVERLGVRVLPCVIGFANGVVKGKVVGFEGVCWDGKEKDFKVSQALEDTFVSWTVLKKSLLKDDDVSEAESDEDHDGVQRRRKITERRGIKGRKHDVPDDDDDWD